MRYVVKYYRKSYYVYDSMFVKFIKEFDINFVWDDNRIIFIQKKMVDNRYC